MRAPSGAHLSLAAADAEMASQLLRVARLHLAEFGVCGGEEAEFLVAQGLRESVLEDLQRDLEQLSTDLALVADDWGALGAAKGAQQYARR